MSVLSATQDAPATVAPSAAERFFFDNNGYLVLENFLSADHVQRLRAALARVIAHRRALHHQKLPHTGMTQLKGEQSTRIFYILDDDPLFLEMMDWPAMVPYIKGLLNPKAHHHASDAIVEVGSELFSRNMGWHLDGHDNGFRNLGRPIPLLQLKIGYYLTDMTEPGQGNLTIWVSTQGIFQAELQTAALLGLPQSKIKVVPLEVGGAFGGKGGLFLPGPDL